MPHHTDLRVHYSPSDSPTRAGLLPLQALDILGHLLIDHLLTEHLALLVTHLAPLDHHLDCPEHPGHIDRLVPLDHKKLITFSR